MNKHELIYYGDISGINRFVTLFLFQAIGKLNPEVQRKIYEYLEKLEPSFLKKSLIVFAQRLTVASELNVVDALPYIPGSITKLHSFSRQVTYNLRGLDPDLYKRALSAIIENSDINETKALQREEVIFTADKGNLLYHGNIVNKQTYGYKLPIPDLDQIDLNSDSYVETRPGLAEGQ